MKAYLRARAEQAAKSLRLGKLVAEYQQGVTPPMKGLVYGTMGLLLLLLIGLPVAVILLLILTPYPLPGSFIVFVLAMAITFWLLLLGTTIWAWYAYWSDPWGMLLYAEGFVDVRMRRVRGVRWDHIETVQQRPTNRGARYILRTSDRATFSFGTIYLNLATTQPTQDLEVQMYQFTAQLHATIEREVAIWLWERILEDYQAGLPVAFGPLRVSRQGVSDGQVHLPWNKMAAVRLGDDDRYGSWHIIRELKPLASQQASHTAMRSLLERHLSCWLEEVSSSTYLQIAAKDVDVPPISLPLSQVPNALLLVTLFDYLFHQHPEWHAG